MTPVPKFKVAITIKAFCLNHTLISRILQARKVATPGNFDFVDVDDGGGDDDDDDDESGEDDSKVVARKPARRGQPVLPRHTCSDHCVCERRTARELKEGYANNEEKHHLVMIFG